jgi:hypothetical protein
MAKTEGFKSSLPHLPRIDPLVRHGAKQCLFFLGVSSSAKRGVPPKTPPRQDLGKQVTHFEQSQQKDFYLYSSP